VPAVPVAGGDGNTIHGTLLVGVSPQLGSLVVAVTLPWPPLAVKLVLEAADNVYVQVFPATDSPPT